MVLHKYACMGAFVQRSELQQQATVLAAERALTDFFASAGDVTERKRAEAETARLLEETDRRRRAAESLAELGRVISRSLDPEEVAQQICDSIAKLLGTETAAVYRLEEASGDLVALATCGNRARVTPGTRVPRGMGTVSRAVRERRTVTSTDLLNDPTVTLTPELRAMVEGQTMYRAVLSVPLVANDHVVGALAVGERVGWVFDPEQIRIVELFAAQAALALAHARMHEETRRRLKDTETLLAVSQAAATTLEPREALRRITRLLVQSLGADLGGLLYFDAPEGRVVPLAGYHVPPGLLQAMAAEPPSLSHRFFDEMRRLERPLRASDSADDPRFGNDAWTASFPHTSILIMPVRIKDDVRGVFTLAWTRDRRIVADDELRLAEGVVRQAATEIEKLELLEGLQRQQRRLEALLEATRQLSSIKPLETVLQQIAEACGQLLGTTAVGVRVVEGNELVAAGTWGEASELMSRARIEITEGLAGAVVRDEGPIIAAVANDPRVTERGRETARRLGYRTWVGVPVKVGDRVVGTLGIWIRREGFSADDLAMASAFAAQAATALENARLYQEVRQAYDQLSHAQEQLAQAQRLEAVGRLAGGVAHDFNNLLTVITGRAELAQSALGEDHPVSRHVALIEKAAQRAASLTRQLLAFSRKQVLQPKILDVNDVVRNFGGMLGRLIGEHIELTTTLACGLAPVKADPGQLDQVLMNLVVNARDAMPRGGRVTIETAHVALDDAYAARHPDVAAGTYVLLAVTDTGTGIDPSLLPHVFEPFFTTKEQGKGTGLGLATVYGIVKQSGGHVVVRSEPGLGTTFKIYLPVVESVAAPEANDAASACPQHGEETVLLVEDEQDIRDFLREVLMAGGYTVLAAPDAAVALEICDRHAGPIDLLVTDVVMPRMSGPELAVDFRRRRPETKVLYMSGYTDGAIAQQGELEPGVAFVQKPFTPAVMSRRIREVLDRPAA
jgi:signal transduction histidine kinase